MKITDLLNKLDVEKPEDSNHSAVIYGDGSGQISISIGDELIDWSDKKEMEEKLTALWNELNDNIEKWEL